MASQLQIVNLALTRLGVPRITAMSDSVKAARSATAVWEMIRDEVLAKHPWNRVTARTRLRRTVDASKTITGVSAATSAVVTTSVAHGYLVDDVALIVGVAGCLDSDGVSVLNDLYHTITAVTATTYTISTDTSSTAATAYTSNGRSLRARMKRLDATLTITGITAANPGVVTSAANGLENGDEVYLAAIVGMTELNGRYFTVGTTTTNTFGLLGINTSAYTAYSSAGTAQKVLGELTDWDYAYALPSDCLRVLDLPDNEDAEFQVETGGILVCDLAPPVDLRYIRKETDYTVYEPLLVNALASRLAAELCQDVTGNIGKKQAALAEYMGFIEEAKLTDLREQTPTEISDDTWITERD